MCGQFGVAGKRKKRGTTFQELNEEAKKMTGGDVGGAAHGIGMGDGMEELMKSMGDIDMGDMEEVMKMMSEMSPDEMMEQMQQAMDMFTGDDMMNNMLGNRDEILETLEKSQMVDEEELEKFKTDPDYFEEKMRDSLDQMRGLFSDPDAIANAKENFKAAQELYSNPEAANEMVQSLLKDISDDDIESVRQSLLGNGDLVDPAMKQLFASMDINDKDLESLQDPIKWRESVREGLGSIDSNDDNDNNLGAGIGEL